MTLVGFDLNATRIRAVSGPAGIPRRLALDGSDADLPMALSLEDRTPEVGRAGARLCRRLPHLACLNFLPHLGLQREWTAGRHQLDAAAALCLVFEHLQPALQSLLANPKAKMALALAVPAYLSPAQVGIVTAQAKKARLPMLGSATAPLATALAGYAEHPWSGLALVVDADDHALTWTTVSVQSTKSKGTDQSLELWTLDVGVWPELSLQVWKARLLDGIAERCIRHSRRDPRESAVAEQMLYEQLEGALDICRQGRMVEVVIQAASWYQNLILRPEEVDAMGAPLVRQALEGMGASLEAAQSAHLPSQVLVTDAAGRLPGLLTALQNDTAEQTKVTVLSADAVARAAHALAAGFAGGRLSRGHIAEKMPLPKASDSPSALGSPPGKGIRLWAADR